MIKKVDDGWFVDVEPVKGKRHRKTLPTKAEALRFEATIRARYARGEAWNPRQKDRRRLSEIVARWYDLHGHSLSDGERRRNILVTLAADLGDPIAADLTGRQFAELRKVQLASKVSGKTLNNRLGYLKSVFLSLRKLKEIDYENPLADVEPLKLQERELTFLTTEQTFFLLRFLRERTSNPHVSVIARVCASTGCRWSEAENLRLSALDRPLLTFVNTKSKRTRSVPISDALLVDLQAHYRAFGEFTSSLPTFTRLLGLSGLPVAPGQASHLLRHTFASHFVMRGGNILTLQKILGHASLTMTMRYAHLSPDHLKEAVTLGPLSGFDTFSTVSDPEKEKALENQGLNLS